MPRNHPITTVLDFNNHRAMAAYWSDECISSMRRAIATPNPPTAWDHDLMHAIRSARMAIWHATKAAGLKSYAAQQDLPTGA